MRQVGGKQGASSLLRLGIIIHSVCKISHVFIFKVIFWRRSINIFKNISRLGNDSFQQIHSTFKIPKNSYVYSYHPSSSSQPKNWRGQFEGTRPPNRPQSFAPRAQRLYFKKTNASSRNLKPKNRNDINPVILCTSEVQQAQRSSLFLTQLQQHFLNIEQALTTISSPRFKTVSLSRT